MTLRVLVVTNRKTRDVDSLRSRLGGPMRALRLRTSKLVTAKEFLDLTECKSEVVLVDSNSVNGQTGDVLTWCAQMGVAVVQEKIGRRGKINLTNVEEWMKANKRDVGATVVELPGKATEPNAVPVEAAVEVAEANHTHEVAIFEGEVREVEPGVKLARLTGQTEVRAIDTDYAERLGYAEPRKIRPLYERHLPAMAELGGIVKRRIVGRLGTRGNLPPVEVEAYLLSKEQMAYLAAKSETPNAVRLTVAMVKVATAWEEGRLPGVVHSDDDSLVNILARATDAKLKRLAQDNEVFRAKQAEQDAATQAAQRAADEARATAGKAEQKADAAIASIPSQVGAAIAGYLPGDATKRTEIPEATKLPLTFGPSNAKTIRVGIQRRSAARILMVTKEFGIADRLVQHAWLGCMRAVYYHIVRAAIKSTYHLEAGAIVNGCFSSNVQHWPFCAYTFVFSNLDKWDAEAADVIRDLIRRGQSPSAAYFSKARPR